ncbi:hypothetical protein KAU04_03380 [bacterium]|nr:hypothetical protein [bacterium]MCK4597048.1 hypothetical protein [bacterium]
MEMGPEVQRRKSHFCSVCQRVVKMDMLRKGPVDDVTWLKCPDCEGIVPVLSAAIKELMGMKEEVPGTVMKNECPEYEMSGNYDVGQIFYHKIWDDYGMVLQKGKESQKGRAIMVSFLRGGLKKIVENYQSLDT